MRFRLMSDLHIEFSLYTIPTTIDDLNTVLLLAGDIGVYKHTTEYVDFLVDCSTKFKHVVAIPGNHEFYKSNIKRASIKVLDAIKDIPNISILEKATVVIEDVAVIGCTLWADFNKNPLDKFTAQQNMNDYKQIRYGPESTPWMKKLSADDTFHMHLKHKQFLFDEISSATQKGLKTIGITHHGCTYQSISPAFAHSNLNYSYVSDLSNEILQYKPNVMVHGHVHQSFDYAVDTTRVICNPRGYTKNGVCENANFDEFLYFDI